MSNAPFPHLPLWFSAWIEFHTAVRGGSAALICGTIMTLPLLFSSQALDNGFHLSSSHSWEVAGGFPAWMGATGVTRGWEGDGGGVLTGAQTPLVIDRCGPPASLACVCVGWAPFSIFLSPLHPTHTHTSILPTTHTYVYIPQFHMHTSENVSVSQVTDHLLSRQQMYKTFQRT